MGKAAINAKIQLELEKGSWGWGWTAGDGGAQGRNRLIELLPKACLSTAHYMNSGCYPENSSIVAPLT